MMTPTPKRTSRDISKSFLLNVAPETVSRCWWKDVSKHCVLVAMDVFEIVSQGSDRARGQIKAFGYVDVNADGELMHFAETAALNRGLPVAFFPTVADAEHWLLSGNGKDTLATTARLNL